MTGQQQFIAMVAYSVFTVFAFNFFGNKQIFTVFYKTVGIGIKNLSGVSIYYVLRNFGYLIGMKIIRILQFEQNGGNIGLLL